jgi:hypothetical protein
MRREWEPEDLIACWTLVEADWLLVANKSGPTRLGFALALKFFELEGRFPRQPGDLPAAAVEYVAGQVKVDPGVFSQYDFSSRTAKYHRVQIRSELGFREANRADEQRLTMWLAAEVCPVELVEDRQREALLRRCRQERIEPPGRAERILAAARRVADEQLCAQTVTRLPEQTVTRLDELVADELTKSCCATMSGSRSEAAPACWRS